MSAHCYVAAMPGMPGYFWAAVDCPEMAKDNAKSVAKYIREGFPVTRVTVEEARAGLDEFLTAKQDRGARIEAQQP